MIARRYWKGIAIVLAVVATAFVPLVLSAAGTCNRIDARTGGILESLWRRSMQYYRADILVGEVRRQQDVVRLRNNGEGE